HLYVAASSAMDLFDAAGGLDAVEMTSTAPEGWTLPAVQEALASGQMTYIGKYSAPDYEQLTASGCGLAVESTMIYHSPEVREKIETLGIPVLTERSSYESHPLGRMEWMKLYGLLLGREAEAQAAFAERTSRFETLEIPDIPEEERPTAAFFSVNSNGSVTIRKPGDYVSQMIALAGGRYCFTAEGLSVEENALSTMNIQMEAFYDAARDADYLIYNSTIEGDLDDLDALLSKSSIFADFRAVKEDHVWCTGQNLFQQTTGAAEMIADLNCIFTGQAEDAEALTFLHRLH
ncbi:MAG: ABC transporter substrate-binding protein, partial [Oscillospiraceae bacterium]|nr:ABC transporter substrate-binding protein [Oscillospiraceae bacterium]